MARRRTIGVVSKATGVKVTTIRYYESIGLMNEPGRTESGQREYSQDDQDRVAIIRHARALGFSVDAIRELIELQTDASRDCASVDAAARARLGDVRLRIRQLSALALELERMIESCAGGDIGDCAVMSALNDHGQCLNDDHTHDGGERRAAKD